MDRLRVVLTFGLDVVRAARQEFRICTGGGTSGFFKIREGCACAGGRAQGNRGTAVQQHRANFLLGSRANARCKSIKSSISWAVFPPG